MSVKHAPTSSKIYYTIPTFPTTSEQAKVVNTTSRKKPTFPIASPSIPSNWGKTSEKVKAVNQSTLTVATPFLLTDIPKPSKQSTLEEITSKPKTTISTLFFFTTSHSSSKQTKVVKTTPMIKSTSAKAGLSTYKLSPKISEQTKIDKTPSTSVIATPSILTNYPKTSELSDFVDTTSRKKSTLPIATNFFHTTLQKTSEQIEVVKNFTTTIATPFYFRDLTKTSEPYTKIVKTTIRIKSISTKTGLSIDTTIAKKSEQTKIDDTSSTSTITKPSIQRTLATTSESSKIVETNTRKIYTTEYLTTDTPVALSSSPSVTRISSRCFMFLFYAYYFLAFNQRNSMILYIIKTLIHYFFVR